MPTLVDSILMGINGLCEEGVSVGFAKAMNYGEGNITNGLSISNIGMLPIPSRYGGMTPKEATFVPPIMPNGRDLIGILSSEDGMVVSHHFFATGKANVLQTDLLKRLGEALDKVLR